MVTSFPLQELIDLEELQSIQDSFARAVGISSVILSPEGEPLTRFTNPTGFCSLIQSSGKGKERCFRSFMEMGRIALGAEKSEIFYCFADGGHFVAPIVIDGEHKGTMFAGQFIPEKFSFEQLKNLEEIAPEIDLDPALLRKEAENMRVVREDLVRNYSNLLFKIVETIARRGAQAAELVRVNNALERAHAALELRFRDIAGAMSDWLWEVDADVRYTYCSERVKDVLGYSAEEMIGKTPFDLMIPDEMAKAGAEFAEIVREKRPIRDMENWLRTRDGQAVCMLTSGVPIVNDAGELLGYRGVDSDITELKKAEEMQRATEERFRMMFESMSNAVAVYDAVDGGKNFIFKDFNKAGEKMDDIKKEDVIGKSVIDVFPGVIDLGLVDVFRRVWQTGEPEHFPISFYKDDRIAGWRENYVYKLPSGEIVAIYEDITERKAAQEALRESEERYRTFHDSSKDAIMTLTPEEGYLNGNPAAVEIFGCKDEKDFISRTPHDLSPQYQPDGALSSVKAEQMIAIAMEKGSHFFEWTHKRMDGQKFPVTVLLTGMELQGRRIFQATVRDITEQKAAEEAVRESEEKMRMITACANDAVIMMDNEGNTSYWNRAAQQMFGYTEDEVIGKELHRTLTPERFYDDYLKGFEGFRETGQGTVLGKTLELAAVGKDGTEFPVELSFSAVKLKGEWNAIGLMRDITGRKATEEEIKKKTDELEKFNKLSVGRELKMIELKKEINALVEAAGEGPRYEIAGES